MAEHKEVKVYLTEAQRRQLKLIAVHEGTNVSELMRQAADALILSKAKAHYAGELAKIQNKE